LRNAILKGVPKAFWDDMYQAARKIVMGDFRTLANRRAEAVKTFQGYGISQEQIIEKLGLAGVEDITLEHLVTLRGLLTAIKEGDTTPEQAFSDTKSKPASKPKEEKQEKKELATCTEEEFAELAKEWEPLVRSGKKKASAIISTAKTTMVLTHDQECQIDAWEKEGQ
jgi:transposase